MLTPSIGDGSMYDTEIGDNGEWIELYNPNLCKPIDVSCYYLGNNAWDFVDSGNVYRYKNYGAGYRIPPKTIIPARGFLVIRGTRSPAVADSLLFKNGGKTIELIADDSIGNICISGRRLWFPNKGGWFAFYDSNGIPQDAISWNSITNSCMSCNPCVTSCPGCKKARSLASYDSIPENRKSYITSKQPDSIPNVGKSWHRTPDGGNWIDSSTPPTMGFCNDICNPPPIITCTGKAWVTASGGTPPYAFRWDDSQLSAIDTAKGLCAGIYHVTVTDSGNKTSTIAIEVKDLVLNGNISATDIKCYGDKNGSITATALNGTSPYTFLWNTGDTISAINNLSAGDYSAIISDYNGCGDTLYKTITQPEKLTIAVNKYKNKLCYNDTTKLFAIPNNGYQPYTYIWDPDNNTTQSITLKNTQDLLSYKNFKVTVNDNHSCKDSATVSLTFLPEIKALATADSTCPKACDAQITLKVKDSDGNSDASNMQYLWSNGQTSKNDTLLCNGLYKVTITDANNCKKIIDSLKVELFLTDTTISVSTTSGYSPLVVNFIYNVKAENINWKFGDGDSSQLSNTTHKYFYNSKNTQNGQTYYNAEIIIDNGKCRDTISFKIEVKISGILESVSNVISINNSPYNWFGVIGRGLKTFNLKIFDRWGVKVYEASDYVDSEPKVNGDEVTYHLWDGNNKNGNKVSEGTYFYILNAVTFDDKTLPNKQGTITVLSQ